MAEPEKATPETVTRLLKEVRAARMGLMALGPFVEGELDQKEHRLQAVRELQEERRTLRARLSSGEEEVEQARGEVSSLRARLSKGPAAASARQEDMLKRLHEANVGRAALEREKQTRVAQLAEAGGERIDDPEAWTASLNAVGLAARGEFAELRELLGKEVGVLGQIVDELDQLDD